MNLRTLTHVEMLFEIYAVAGELPPEQRESYLQAHLPEPRDRQLLLDLLQSELHSSQAAGLLDQAWPAEPEALQPGTTLGSFRIEGELGCGGQGRVYLATQAAEVVERKFALKLPHRLSGESLTNLRHEARAVSKLEHPGIARFLYIDRTAAGQWFLVTEYVQGQRLDQALHGAPAARVLGVFVHLCDALAHAHAQGVAHLDLKPSNVLLAADDQPRILDFGLGLIQLPQSSSKSVRGYTLPYAAPEQVRGDPSLLSDIHALGTLLLQIITATPPEHLVAQRERLRDPTLSTPLRAQLGPDLYAILQRACAADAAVRYPSVAQFGADLRAMQAREPVSARAWTWRYALACLLRRRPWASAAVIAGVLLMGVALLALTLQRASLQRAEAQARTEAERARSGMRLLVSAMESADPESAPQVTPAEQALVERLKRAAARSPDAQIRATVDLVVARIARSTGDQRAALALFDDVVVRAQQLGATELLGQALIAKAEAHTELAQYDEAAAALARARELPAQAVEQAALLRAEGRRLLKAAQLDTAELKLREALAATNADDRLRIGTINDLGTIALDRGHFAEAARLFDQQQPLVDAVYGADSVAAGVNAHNRASAYRGLEQTDKALAQIRDAQRIYAARLGPHSARHADALMVEAIVLFADDPDRAATCLQQAIAAYREVYGANSPKIAHSLYFLGNIYLEAGDADAALREFASGIAIVQPQLPATHPLLAVLNLGLGSALLGQDKASAALAPLQSALQGMQASNPEPGPAQSSVFNELSRAYRLLGRAADSEAASATAYEGVKQAFPPQSVELVPYQLERAASLALAGRASEADALLAGARALLDTQGERPAAQRLRPRLQRAEAYVRDRHTADPAPP